jgi:hypothetical protein
MPCSEVACVLFLVDNLSKLDMQGKANVHNDGVGCADRSDLS